MKIMKNFIKFLMSLDGFGRVEIILPLIMGLFFLFIPSLGWCMEPICLMAFLHAIGENS